MITNHRKTHVVFPGDCNSMGTIFGGKILCEFDLVAFEHSILLLQNSLCNDAVTVGIKEVSFLYGPREGEMLEFHSVVKKIGIKSLTFDLICVTIEGKEVAKGEITFVCRQNGQTYPHGLERL